MILQSLRLLTGLLFMLHLFTINLLGQTSIDSTTVLKVGNVSFTGYELEKNLVIFKDTFRQKNGRDATNADIDQWIRSFVDRAYLLADAWDKSYHLRSETISWVSSMERFIISQPGGLLDDKMVGELTELEIQEGVLKHLRKLHFRYVKFPDLTSALSQLGDNASAITTKQFEELFRKGSSVPGIRTGQDIVQWPFFQRGEREELILNLREGEISSLTTLADGIYIAQAIRVETVNVKDLPPNFKQVITSILKQQKQQQAGRRFYEESIHNAAIKFDETVLSALKAYLADKGSIPSFEKSMFPTIRQQTAITYQLNGSTRPISADRWMNYYNQLPMRKTIVQENLIPYMEAMVLEDYAFEKARQTGVTSELKFVLDKINYEKNVVFSIYEREELKKDISVTEDEISQRYEQTKNEYRQATEAVITVFSFPERKNVAMGYMALRKGQVDSLIKSNAIETHRSIKYNDAIFTDSIRNVIFSMKLKEPSSSIPYNGSWLMIIKESESGNRIRELQEVRSIISKKIEEEKLDQKKQLLVEAFKRKYSIRQQIDAPRYYSKNQSKSNAN